MLFMKLFKFFKVHMILLDPKKITQFIVDVTNAHDKEYFADVIKAPVTGKTKRIRAGNCKTRHGYPWHGIIPYTVLRVRILCKGYYIHIYTNKLKWLCTQCIAPLNFYSSVSFMKLLNCSS